MTAPDYSTTHIAATLADFSEKKHLKILARQAAKGGKEPLGEQTS